MPQELHTWFFARLRHVQISQHLSSMITGECYQTPTNSFSEQTDSILMPTPFSQTHPLRYIENQNHIPPTKANTLVLLYETDTKAAIISMTTPDKTKQSASFLQRIQLVSPHLTATRYEQPGRSTTALCRIASPKSNGSNMGTACHHYHHQ